MIEDVLRCINIFDVVYGRTYRKTYVLCIKMYKYFDFGVLKYDAYFNYYFLSTFKL